MSPYQGGMRDPSVVWMLAALLLSPGAFGVACADEGHDRARQALQAGEIKPLRVIVENAERHCGGHVIEVELEEGSRDGRKVWLYLLRMMTPGGDVLKLDVNAATSEILKVKGRGSCR